MRSVRLAIPLLWSVPALGGCGLFVDIGNPQTVTDPRARKAFATVRVFNCLGATTPREKIPYPATGTRVEVIAEGLVAGKRVSVPLTVTQLSIPGVGALEWDQPKQGVWVLNCELFDTGQYQIDGKDQPLGVLIPVVGGAIERRVRLVEARATEDAIAAALRKLMGHESKQADHHQ